MANSSSFVSENKRNIQGPFKSSRLHSKVQTYTDSIKKGTELKQTP